MAHASFDPGNASGVTAERPTLRRWVLVVPMLGLLGVGLYVLLNTNPSQPETPVDKHLKTFIPNWQPVSYDAKPEPAAEMARPDRTQELLAQLTRQQDDLRKELAALRAANAARPPTGAGTAAGQPGAPPKKRRHAAMLVIDHPPPEVAADTRPQYLLGAGTFLPCIVESHVNSDVPGAFTVKTRAPVYDTATGRHLLIKQNQSIVATAASENLLFGNTRIPTFSMTMSNADGTSVDLGEAPVVDGRGTNGLTGRVDNHIFRLLWTSIFIGGLRGGQQAIQAGITPGDPTGLIASNVTGQVSQVGQTRLGRAQDVRPEIQVEAGSLCNVLLTKAIQLPEIKR